MLMGNLRLLTVFDFSCARLHASNTSCRRNMAQHDLFPKFAQFLDPQLAFALLEFAASQGIYDKDDVTRARIKLLHGTNMVEYEASLYQELGQAAPEELQERHAAVIKQVTEVQEKAKPIIDILSKEENISQLKADRTQNMAFMKVRLQSHISDLDHLRACARARLGRTVMLKLHGACDMTASSLCAKHLHCSQSLTACACSTALQPAAENIHERYSQIFTQRMQDQFGIGPDQIEALYHMGKALYNSASYAQAQEMLHQFTTYSLDAGRILQADWGKLACEILEQKV
jgi:eIF3 subunit 6 N terminal domain